MLAAHKLSVLFARFLIIAWYFWHSHSQALGFTELFRFTGSAPLPATSLRPTWTHFARFITHWAGRPRISCILFRNSGRAKDFEVNCCTKKRCMLTYSAPAWHIFLRWNWQRATRRQPVILWMALETLVGAQWNKTSKRCATFLQRISHDCENLTELGLLQLPLSHQGASPQHQVDGSKD